jgi:4-hydroxythreonine-4-phosphate dehydrogenase
VKAKRFALTPGEPAGIGPDLCLLLASHPQPHPLIAITSHDLLLERAVQLGVAVNLLRVTPDSWPDLPAPAGSLYVWDTPLNAQVVTGQLNTANAAFVLQTLTRAGQGCIDGDFAGMITRV